VSSTIAIVVAPPARANDVADAEDLFRRAKALMAAKRYGDACPLLKESNRLDPGMGTRLNLALCYEANGQIALAWGEFRAVEQQARAANPPKEERIKLARDHADKLEPRVSHLRLRVPDAARAPGLAIKVDGEDKREPTWGSIAVDTGSRQVEVSATGKKTATLKVRVESEGANVDVIIPALEDLPKTQPPQAASPSANMDELEEYASNRARRTTGFVVGGIGLATAAAGGVFGVLAMTSGADAKDKCPSPCIRGTDQANASDQATDKALIFANVANVLIPLGVIGAAIGGYLVLSAGPTEKVAIVPAASARFAGLGLAAEW
jgi:hypothetical protein